MSQSHTPYGSVPGMNDAHSSRGYGGSVGTDFAQSDNPTMSSPLSQSMGQQQHYGGAFREDFDATRPDSSYVDHSATTDTGIDRSASTASTAVPGRSNTLKKKSSVRRTGSLKRSSSRKSLKAGSIKGVGGADGQQDFNSAFYTPVPTQGSPTEILANRFQAWRQLLKSLIAYFREIQSSYEVRAKAVNKVQNTLAGIAHPAMFMSERGLGDAARILEDYHKHSLVEANKSRDIENDVIGALTGLRGDLSQKIKEIKSLSGDFKNTVDREKEATRREVDKLQEALQHADHEDGSATGKNDPFVVRLGVDRMVEKQIDEENYLHRAYLNLESSGRELESIVVGEIQKAYNALAGILRREADDAYNVVDTLRSGPIALPKDSEWLHFVSHDPHFVAPNVHLRRIEDIHYPGRDNPAAQEIRAGMLERKSKYLKSYTPGWYVLSPTHLHEFKSADKIYTQPPVMSLYLGEQRLGSRSELGSSSHKFMLKGRQTGSMHKGHSWVFRAESHDTMLAWFNDIKTLTETKGAERDAFVRKHARSVSGNSERPHSVSSDGFEEDEADEVPYSADAASLAEQHPMEEKPQRPQPGGRFPSDLQIPRIEPMSPSSNSSQEPERENNATKTLTPVVAQEYQRTGADTYRQNQTAAATLAPVTVQEYQRTGADPYRLEGVATGSRQVSAATAQAPTSTSYDEDQERYLSDSRAVASSGGNQYAAQPSYQPPESSRNTLDTQSFALPLQPKNERVAMNQHQPSTQAAGTTQTKSFLGHEEPSDYAPVASATTTQPGPSAPSPLQRHESTYGEWFAPTAATAAVGAGVIGVESQRRKEEAQREKVLASPADQETAALPSRPVERDVAFGSAASSAVPVMVDGPASSAEPAAATSLQEPTTMPTEPAQSTVPQTSVLPTSEGFAAPMTTSTTGLGSGGALGGLEKEGAHETGQIFPRLLRHDTDMSISRLHVPGEFPKRK